MKLIRTFSNPVICGTWIDNKSITNEIDFVVDDLGPLCVNNAGDSFYSLLFFATQYSTEETIYLQLLLKSNDRFERDFLDNVPINMNNMLKYKDRIEYYVEHTKGATNNKIYICDMNMIEENSKPYFLSYSFRKDQEEITKINLHFTRDVFVKYNIYMRSFIRKNIAGEIVFNNPKFKNMKFSTVDHIKLDGSGTEIDGNLVFSHYTCGNGPELYKFVTVSKKIKGRKLLNPMSFNVFNELYMKDFIVNDAIYEPENDCLYVLYDIISDVTGKYKETKVLRFYKNFYERTDLLFDEKIYEKEKDKDEESNN